MIKGRARASNPAIQRLRALTILKSKIMTAASNDQLAKDFRCSLSTIKRNLAFAMKEDLLRDLEDTIVRDLGPIAVKAVKEAMENGNANAALEVLKGIGLLRKQVDFRQVRDEGSTEESLEIYIKRKKADSELDTPTIVDALPANTPTAIESFRLGEPAKLSSQITPTAVCEVDGEVGMESETESTNDFLFENGDGEGGSDEPEGNS